MPIHQYHFPTKIHFGAGAIGLLPGALREAGRARPLIVTDRGVGSLPWVAALEERLNSEGLAARVFALECDLYPRAISRYLALHSDRIPPPGVAD